MTVRHRTNLGKALQLPCSNADGVRGRKLELQQFLSDHGVDIFLLNETHLESYRTLRLANQVCHRSNRPPRGGGTANLIRRGIDNYAVPVLGLQHLEATAIHIVLATTPVKLVAASSLRHDPWSSLTRSSTRAEYISSSWREI
jgi:hypothetical protein